MMNDLTPLPTPSDRCANCQRLVPPSHSTLAGDGSVRANYTCGCGLVWFTSWRLAVLP